MHVIHVIRDLDVASGGPSRSVPALAEHQSALDGVKVSLVYQDRGKPVVPLTKGNVDYRAVVGARGFTGNFMIDFSRLDLEPDKHRIFHLHGLWNPLLHQAARFARKQQLPYVISTRGMLASWAIAHKAFKKRIAWKLYQEKDLLIANYLLASSAFEQQEVSVLLPQAKVEIIPNGCAKRPDVNRSQAILNVAQGMRWALAMGRLHPVKGYAELIEAWASLSPPQWKLAIAGPDEAGYRSTLERLISTHHQEDRILLLGEVDDKQKWFLLDQCELFVAPSKTENFGMAIAEALQSGTPVITTTGTPWNELTEFDCGWWIESDVSAIEEALSVATNLDEGVLRRMGENGHRLIMEKYSWGQVAARTIDLYREVLGLG